MGIMLEEIAAYLITSGICTALQTDLFVAEVPEKNDLVVMLFEYGGSPSDHTLDGERFLYPGLQVRVRGKRNGYLAGKQKADQVDALLDGLSNTVIGTHRYFSIFANHSPAFMGYAEGGHRPEWTQNFRVCKEP